MSGAIRGGPIRAAVLTVSDRCSRGERTDASGPALEGVITGSLGGRVVDRACVPDDAARIEAAMRRWAEPGAGVDLVVSTGGTGLAPRDFTPEAASRVIERPHPALLELARLRCLEKTPRTYLSRGVSGSAGRTLILTLPGSPRGAREWLEALVDILPHAIETLRGEVVDG